MSMTAPQKIAWSIVASIFFLAGLSLAFAAGKSAGRTQCRSGETMPLMSLMDQIKIDIQDGKSDLALKRLTLISDRMAMSQSPESFHGDVITLIDQAGKK